MPRKPRRMPRKAYKNNSNIARYGYGAYKAVKYGAKAAPIVAAAVKYIGGLVNAERHQKILDLSLTTSNTGVVNLLSGIAQGDDISNRQGNSVKTIDLMGNITFDQANNTSNFVRVILFMDTANQGVTPSISDVLTASVTVNSQRNVDNMKRFKIFQDRLFSFDPDTKTRALKVYKKLGMHLRFSASTATDVLQNAIYLLILDSNGTDHCAFSSSWKLSFYDN